MTARTFSLVRCIFWIALSPVAYYLGWLESVVFVSFLSLWALAESAYSARRADMPTPGEDGGVEVKATIRLYTDEEVRAIAEESFQAGHRHGRRRAS